MELMSEQLKLKSFFWQTKVSDSLESKVISFNKNNKCFTEITMFSLQNFRTIQLVLQQNFSLSSANLNLCEFQSISFSTVNFIHCFVLDEKPVCKDEVWCEWFYPKKSKVGCLLSQNVVTWEQRNISSFCVVFKFRTPKTKCWS